MKNKYASRDINLDVMRCVAVLSVFQVHFLLNINFYGYVVGNSDTAIMCVMSTVFRVCVPLFLLLSGYLLCHKTLGMSYYKGVFRVIITYVITSAICIILLKYTDLKDYDFKSAVLAILSINGSKYAWYVEMYLGLFIVIPFLNMLWEKLDTKKKRTALTVSLLILTLAPKMLNAFNFRQDGWFAQPSMDKTYDVIFPDWWINIYPVTYYFIGAYIRDEKVKMYKPTNVLLLLAAILFFSVTNFYRSRGGVFVSGAPVDWGGAGCTVLSVLTFLLIKDLKFTAKLPKPIKYCISRVSYLSLSMYLTSAAIDAVLYTALKATIPEMHNQLIFFPVTVSFVFVFTAVISEIADRIAINPLTKLSEIIYDRCTARLTAKSKSPEVSPADVSVK